MNEPPKPPRIDVLTLRPGLQSNEDGGNVGNGLPEALTREFVTEAIGLVKKFNKPRKACISAGITGATYDRWVAWVKSGVAHPSLVSFFEALERADALAETDMVTEIRDQGDTSAKMKLLERGRPEEWSKTEHVVIVGAIKELVDRARLQWAPEHVDMLLRLMGG